MTTEHCAKKVAEALAYLDIEILDMGDSYAEIVENLCTAANITFIPKEEITYLKKQAVEAYCILLRNMDDICVNYINFLYENQYILMYRLVYTGGYTLAEHPTMIALSTFHDFSKNISSCDEAHCQKLQELIDRFKTIDLELCYTGHFLGYRFFRYLNPEWFFISNDAFTVGSILSFEDDEYVLGQYTMHACFNHIGKDNGYTIAFNRVEGKLVARIYEFSKTFNPYSLSHSDLLYEMNVAMSEQSAVLIAKQINELAKKHFIK